MRRVHAELVVDDTDVRPRPRAWRQWLPVAPALAAGLVLGIVAPWGRDNEPAAPPMEGAAPVVRLVGNLRDGVAPEFSVPARARALPMTLAWDPWSLPGAVPASALVFRISAVEDGRVLWTWRTTIAEAWDPAGSAVSFLTPADRLGVGERVLTIEGPDGSEVFSARLILRPR
ncbi:MAG: hypothetical protein IPH86_12715 [bacterium]|nr:hypothetical protein [bacterium]